MIKTTLKLKNGCSFLVIYFQNSNEICYKTRPSRAILLLASFANIAHNTMFIDCVAFEVNRDNRFFKAHNKNQANKWALYPFHTPPFLFLFSVPASFPHTYWIVWGRGMRRLIYTCYVMSSVPNKFSFFSAIAHTLFLQMPKTDKLRSNSNGQRALCKQVYSFVFRIIESQSISPHFPQENGYRNNWV